MRSPHTILALVLMAGCAWSDGEPFAVVDAHLTAALDIPAERDLGGGWQALASGYEVRIDALTFDVEELALLAAGDEAVAFDPADPPPGYFDCHGGHCHTEDGGLASYEEIAAELAAGAGATEVLHVPVGALDLVAGVDRPLTCEDTCALPLAHVTTVAMHVAGLHLTGLVRDGQAVPRIDGEVPFTIDLDLEALTGGHVELAGVTDLPADRSHAPDVALAVALHPTVALLDEVDWLDPASAWGPIAAALSELSLDITVTRD